MINLNDLSRQSLLLAQQRGLKTDVISTLKHCAGEVVEATQAYSDVVLEDDIEDFSLELADIIICVLTASAVEGIDIEEAVNKAMQKNAKRAYDIREG